jgi:6-phosphofructo-2-kinase
LREINLGSFEGMTMDEIKTLHPEEYAAREGNRLGYRYPGTGGESLLDIIERVRPVIIELERMRGLN